MGNHQILPKAEQQDKEIVLVHKNGEIIAINKLIYQIRLFKEPNRKIYSTSIEHAYNILQRNNYDYTEIDFLSSEIKK